MFRSALLLLALLTAAAPSAQDLPPGEAQLAEWDTLVARGEVSPELFLALGNAYYEEGQYGPAVLSFQRGLRLAPGNKDLQNNLRFVRLEANVEELEVPDAAVVRWWRQLGAFLGATTTYVLAMICWWLAVGGAVYWFLRRQQMDERRRFALLPSAGAFLFLAGLFFLLGSSRNAYLTEDRAAVLIDRVADLRVAPGSDATLDRTLTHGHDLRLLDERGAYVKVSLTDGGQGWLPAKAVEKVIWRPAED